MSDAHSGMVFLGQKWNPGLLGIIHPTSHIAYVLSSETGLVAKGKSNTTAQTEQ